MVNVVGEFGLTHNAAGTGAWEVVWTGAANTTGRIIRTLACYRGALSGDGTSGVAVAAKVGGTQYTFAVGDRYYSPLLGGVPLLLPVGVGLEAVFQYTDQEIAVTYDLLP